MLPGKNGPPRKQDGNTLIPLTDAAGETSAASAALGVDIRRVADALGRVGELGM
jgi:hypothetical protein